MPPFIDVNVVSYFVFKNVLKEKLNMLQTTTNDGQKE